MRVIFEFFCFLFILTQDIDKAKILSGKSTWFRRLFISLGQNGWINDGVCRARLYANYSFQTSNTHYIYNILHNKKGERVVEKLWISKYLLPVTFYFLLQAINIEPAWGIIWSTDLPPEMKLSIASSWFTITIVRIIREKARGSLFWSPNSFQF